MKPTNKDLAEAIKIEAQINKLSKRLSEIKSAAKEAGSYVTKDYVVAVSSYERTTLKNQKELVSEQGLDFLTKYDVLKTIECTSVKIAPKNSSVVKVKYEGKRSDENTIETRSKTVAVGTQSNKLRG